MKFSVAIESEGNPFSVYTFHRRCITHGTFNSSNSYTHYFLIEFLCRIIGRSPPPPRKSHRRSIFTLSDICLFAAILVYFGHFPEHERSEIFESNSTTCTQVGKRRTKPYSVWIIDRVFQRRKKRLAIHSQEYKVLRSSNFEAAINRRTVNNS